MYKIFSKKIIAKCLVLLTVITLVLAPVSHYDYSVQTVEAQGRIVFDPSNFVKNALSAGTSIITAGGISYLVFKEKVLDPLSWALINSIISGMLRSLTQWVNSGFQGSPAFVTDIEGFLRNALDDAAGEFLADNGLDFLCSPFKLDVKIALNVQYAQSRNSQTGNTQCTLSDISNNIENFLGGTFSDGGWGSWFELTQGTHNDPNKAYLEGRARMSVVLRNARGREFEILSTNKLFKNMQVCEEGVSVNGSIKNCTITTPGTIIEHQLNDQFDGSRRRLELADEFDELIGALMAQLVNKAFTGLNGLLGLGGSSRTDYSYGADGQSSFLDAMVQETLEQSTAFANSTNPVSESITRQFDFMDLQGAIIEMIDAIEQKLDQQRQTYGSCFQVRMTTALTDARELAQLQITSSNLVLTLLRDLDYRYQTAATADARLAVVSEFNDLQVSGIAATELDIIQAELDIEYVIPDKISVLNDAINAESNRCEQLLN